MRLVFYSIGIGKCAAFAVSCAFLCSGNFLLSLSPHTHKQQNAWSVDLRAGRLFTPGAVQSNRNKQQRISQQTFLSRPKCQWLKQRWLYGRNISSRTHHLCVVVWIIFVVVVASNIHLMANDYNHREWVEWNHWVLTAVQRVKQLNFSNLTSKLNQAFLLEKEAYKIECK